MKIFSLIGQHCHIQVIQCFPLSLSHAVLSTLAKPYLQGQSSKGCRARKDVQQQDGGSRAWSLFTSVSVGRVQVALSIPAKM